MEECHAPRTLVDKVNRIIEAIDDPDERDAFETAITEAYDEIDTEVAQSSERPISPDAIHYRYAIVLLDAVNTIIDPLEPTGRVAQGILCAHPIPCLCILRRDGAVEPHPPEWAPDAGGLQ